MMKKIAIQIKSTKNARNSMKTLLRGPKESKKKSTFSHNQQIPKINLRNVKNENKNNGEDFLNEIDTMRSDLFHKLEI